MTLYVVGGQQRAARKPLEEWHSYEAALVLGTASDSGVSFRRLEYVTPLEARADELAAVVFKAGTLAGNTLYLCTSTEVMTFHAGDFQRTRYLSLPCFNDLHHVCPTPGGNLLIAVTGLDMVIEVTPEGEILREWGVLGGNPWERFSRQIDYRKVLSTKPHASHPNFVFQTGEDVWVTRFHQRDAVCLTDPAKRIDIAIQGGHDGHVHGDFVYFTTVDGHVVIANHRTQKIEHIAELRPADRDRDLALGWCRGLLLLNERLAWVGFSRIRATKFQENLAWAKNGFRALHRPSRLALYDLNTGECRREISLEPYGMNGIFSIFDATPVEQPAPAVQSTSRGAV
jgi:hypothetical protein